ncbi:MAG: stalk domain-containing protein, partial [Bacillota bacterium]|nr:stalk domain-containing protein [Bacillota bacterium]
YSDNKDIEMWIGKLLFYENGSRGYLSTQPYIVNGSTLVPLKDMASALDISVSETGQGENVEKINITINLGAVIGTGINFYGQATTAGAVEGQGNLGQKARFWGAFSNGAMTYGAYRTEDGCRYFGGWSSHQFNGNGRLINPLGELSVGAFANGYMTEGITYFVDGSTFEGKWYYNTNTSAIYPGSGVLTANGRSYGTTATEWSGGALSASKW